MALEKHSPCKVNLLLNILGRRPDGFHELETVMHPVACHDHLSFARVSSGVQLSCNLPGLPVDSGNLVHRAATAFLAEVGTSDGVRIHLEKNLPLAAGLGGGSANAAITLLGLNELFGYPLTCLRLQEIGSNLGSDVPFFLQSGPALGTGRGEIIHPVAPLPALRGKIFLLIHPGFGIATAWAYQQLARFPTALNGQPGRAKRLIEALQTDNLREAGQQFYNSLESPALAKYPVLAMYQEYFRAHGAEASLMSGSGSTTFALFPDRSTAESTAEAFKSKFGEACWLAVSPV